MHTTFCSIVDSMNWNKNQHSKMWIMTQKGHSPSFNLATAANANPLSNLGPNLLMGTWCTHSNVPTPMEFLT